MVYLVNVRLTLRCNGDSETCRVSLQTFASLEIGTIEGDLLREFSEIFFFDSCRSKRSAFN
jgi:hypothetical protein